jgi:eukaryotic-like serine/threonine-protein kinase
MPSAPPTLPDRYQVRRHIASGGMASVWCAEDRLLGRTVAVKVLAERFAHDEIAVRRFKREARTAARVSAHPHVVTVFDVGDIEPPADQVAAGQEPAVRAFIVMEFLSGGTVADAIRVGAVDRDDAIRWLDEAASALDHAHRRGIVHRDIKPANFLLDNSRVLHVADFGIARLTSDETITNSGELFGTAAYLSPEQALGEEATSASDRYSLAVAAFELLAGQRPFQATNFAAQARQHVEAEVPRASELDHALPPAVDSILSRAMAKRPEARYQSAGAFVAALESALEEAAMTSTAPIVAGASRRAATAAAGAAPPTGRVPSPIVAGSLTPRRSGRMFALAALAVVIGGLVALAAFGHGGGSPPAASIASHTATHVKTGVRAPAHRKTHPKAVSSSSATSTSTTPAAASSTTAASAPAPPTSADALEAQGHQELADGNYGTAISTLHQALGAASPSTDTYAFALYDLGRALLLSGDPQAAIPVLEQRLQIPNQTPVVQQTLNQARHQAGQPAASTPTSSTSATAPAPPPPRHDHGHGPPAGNRNGISNGNGSGGAGLPPGPGKHGGGGD